MKGGNGLLELKIYAKGSTTIMKLIIALNKNMLCVLHSRRVTQFLGFSAHRYFIKERYHHKYKVTCSLGEKIIKYFESNYKEVKLKHSRIKNKID